VDPSGTTAAARNAAEGRLTGARAEANGLALLMVITIIFARALAFTWRGRPLVAPLCMAVVVIGLLALFATFSRGGLVVLFAVVLMGIAYGGRLRPAFAMLCLAVVIVGWIFFATSSSGAVERLNLSSTSGRNDIWTVAGRVVEAHPIAGVGSGNFRTVEGQYVVYPGTLLQDEYILDRPKVVHNMLLHVLAEMGIIGLALFLAILGLALRCAFRAVALFRRHGQRPLEVLGRAVVLAIAGSLVQSFFSSAQYNKQLWLLLALCPVLLAIARETSEWAPSADTVAPPFRG
jgi:O-antigen ligase